MTNRLQVVSVKLPLSHLRRIPRNRSKFVRQAVAEKLARESAPDWQPKTATGHKLLELRKRFLAQDRKSTRLNSSHVRISYAVFCLKKKNTTAPPVPARSSTHT